MQVTINQPSLATAAATVEFDLKQVLPMVTAGYPEWTSIVITITRPEWNKEESRKEPQ